MKGRMFQQDFDKRIHAFIFGKLDDFKGVFPGLCKKSDKDQKAAAESERSKSSLRSRKCDTSVEFSDPSDCFPACQRFGFKILLVVCKAPKIDRRPVKNLNIEKMCFSVLQTKTQLFFYSLKAGFWWIKSPHTSNFYKYKHLESATACFKAVFVVM